MLVSGEFSQSITPLWQHIDPLYSPLIEAYEDFVKPYAGGETRTPHIKHGLIWTLVTHIGLHPYNVGPWALPYEVEFWRKSFPIKNRLSENVTFLGFFGGWVWVFSKRFCWICKDFGLEPRREMMRRGQLSFLSNQINSFQLKLIMSTRICRKSGFRKHNIIIPIQFPFKNSGLPIHPSEGCLLILVGSLPVAPF